MYPSNKGSVVEEMLSMWFTVVVNSPTYDRGRGGGIYVFFFFSLYRRCIKCLSLNHIFKHPHHATLHAYNLGIKAEEIEAFSCTILYKYIKIKVILTVIKNCV